jgi:hypothetical protein
MSNVTTLETSLDGLEIGAIGPNELKIVLKAEVHRITLKLTGNEARWLAEALTHWAESSARIVSN